MTRKARQTNPVLVRDQNSLVDLWPARLQVYVQQLQFVAHWLTSKQTHACPHTNSVLISLYKELSQLS